MAQRIHYRLCQCCGGLNSAENELVTTCESCGKHLAPFYFFDESKAMGLDQSNFYSSVRGDAESVLPHKEYPPIWGLTAYWES